MGLGVPYRVGSAKMVRWKFTFIGFIAKPLIVVVLTALTGCSSETTVARKYHEMISASGELNSANQSVIVFLIDGLSVPMLLDAVNARRVPNIENFFSRRGGNLTASSGEVKLMALPFRIGRASFPTLTYPNLVSILTGSLVATHGITGNRVLVDGGKVVNFEDVTNWTRLNAMIHEKTIFTHLMNEHLTSVSYSYPFPANSTAHQEVNLAAGVDYGNKAFNEVDATTLASLRTLLETTAAKLWPRFIFVHMIGVDAFAHEYGPRDEHVQKYIEQLDSNIAEVFKILKNTDRTTRNLSVVLTADHGFSDAGHLISIEKVVAKISPETSVIADNRIASLRFPDALSTADRTSIAEELVKMEHVRWTVLRGKNQLNLYNANGKQMRIDLISRSCRDGSFAARYSSQPFPQDPKPSSLAESDFFCPEKYDADAGFFNDNYLVSSLVEYFTAATAPDMIALPDMDADFIGGYKGNHGGLSKDESFVPVLTYRAHLPEGVQPTYELLRQLGLF